MFFRLLLLASIVAAQPQAPPEALPQEASYNSMTRQIGYCRMQSFDTVSRETSDSVPMFLDGRIAFGVGLPSRDAQSIEAFTCGMCLNITRVENFYAWNHALTVWGDPWPSDQWFLVMVFDECQDDVCQQPYYLDFDVYAETQPVARGNPYGVQWTAVPCPVAPGETLEYLFCTATTCHEGDERSSATTPFEGDERSSATTPFEVYYWSLTVRNFRIPMVGVSVLCDGLWVPLRRENAWVWDQGPFRLDKSMKLKLRNAEGIENTEVVSIAAHGERMESYRGAWRVRSAIHM